MAVNKNTNVGSGFGALRGNQTNQDQTQTGPAQHQESGTQQNTGSDRQSITIGLADINRRINRPISRKGTGERLATVKKAITETIESNIGTELKDTPFRVHPIDASSENIGPLSMVLVTYQEGKSICVYTLLLGQENLPSKQINFNGRSIEQIITSGDIYNGFLWDQIEQILRTSTGAQDVTFLEAGDSVIPPSVNEEDEQRFHAISFSVINALMGFMENYTGNEAPINVGMVANSDRISSEVEYLPGQLEDSFGNPVRTDISLKLRGSVKGQNSQQFDQFVDLAAVDGFVDLLFEPEQNVGPMGMNGPMGSLTYRPNLIVTRVDSQINIQSRELQLLGLVQTRMLSGVNKIIELFRPSHGKKGTDFKDIGAFGLEAPYHTPKGIQPPPGKVWDTKSSKFSDQDFYALFVNTVHNDVVVSMDIEEHGDLTWVNDALIGAADGSPEAFQAIVKAADNLTNGFFSQEFERLGGGPLVNNDFNRIHLGYYFDEDGARRDIRDIDYLAVLNGKDLDVVATWSESFIANETPLEMRMDDRLRILNSLLGKVHVTGFARRLTFTPNFMGALDFACRRAGLQVMATNFKEHYGAGHRQGTSLGQYAMNQVAGASAFSAGYNPYAGYQGMNANASRWERHSMGFNNAPGRR
jgi:hypothetical protein